MKKILIINFFIICFISTLSAQIDSSSTIKRKYFYGSFSTGVGLGYRNYKVNKLDLIKNTIPLPTLFYNVEIGKFISQKFLINLGIQFNKINFRSINIENKNIEKVNRTFTTNSIYFGAFYKASHQQNKIIGCEIGILKLLNGENNFILKNNLPILTHRYYFYKKYIMFLGACGKFCIIKRNHFEINIVTKLIFTSRTRWETYFGIQPIYQPSSNLIYTSLGFNLNIHS